MVDRETKARLLCISDSVIILEGMKAVLGRFPNPKTITTCNSEAELDWSLRTGTFDLALIAWKGSRPGPADLIEKLRTRKLDIKLIVLGDPADQDMLLDALQAGANAVQVLDCSSNELYGSVRKVLAGESYLHPNLVGIVLQHLAKPEKHSSEDLIADLSKRELQVLRCLVAGMNNDEIARELVISLPTVHTHVAHILTKLQVASRTQAVIYALQKGVTTP